jgi:RNA polymerase sigma-70 factor (ECF subfamily)
MKMTPTRPGLVEPGTVSPFNHVVESLRPAIEAVLQRVLGATDPEYEDVVQTALERVITTLDRDAFRGECPLSSWAAVIARKAAADALRDRYRERRVFVYDDTGETWSTFHFPQAAPEERIQARERLKRFVRALSRLGEGSAAVVYLHGVLGYELAEIAAIVGISVAAAQSRLVRGRREIAHRLGRG